MRNFSSVYLHNLYAIGENQFNNSIYLFYLIKGQASNNYIIERSLKIPLNRYSSSSANDHVMCQENQDE